MKKIGMIVLGLGMIFSPLLHGQTTSLNPAVVAAAAVAASQTDPITGPTSPMVGMFYSAQNPNLMATPGNFDNLPVWDLGNGNYLLDDFASDLQPQSRVGGRRMDGDGPPSPGDGGNGYGGTNSSGGGFAYSFDTNSALWL